MYDIIISMNILIANDDGIDATGLKALVNELSSLGTVYVIAPESQRSGNSHRFTYYGRFQIEKREMENVKEAYAIWGSPVDCIHAGTSFIIKDKIDLVVSGINKGWNVLADEMYSATVACAREGYMYGYKSVAFSLDTHEDRDFVDAAKIAKQIVIEYLKIDKPDYFLNVNIPDVKYEDIKGIKVCDKQEMIYYNENYYYLEEGGKTYLALGKPEIANGFKDDDMEIDCNLLRQGYVTISPLGTNPVKYEALDITKANWEGFKFK